MALSRYNSELNRLLFRLQRVPPEKRVDAFLEELEKLPPGKEYDLTMQLVPAVIGLVEGGKSTTSIQPTTHQHHYGPGAGPTFMEEKTTNQMNNSGTFSAPVGFNQTFTNCFNLAKEVEAPATKQALETLIAEVERIHPQLSDGERTKAERKLKTLTEEASQKEPDKDQIALSSKGLIEAAKTCAQIAGPVIIAAKAVAALFGVVLP